MQGGLESHELSGQVWPLEGAVSGRAASWRTGQGPQAPGARVTILMLSLKPTAAAACSMFEGGTVGQQGQVIPNGTCRC